MSFNSSNEKKPSFENTELLEGFEYLPTFVRRKEPKDKRLSLLGLRLGEFDPFTHPPDAALARNHREATRFGPPPEKKFDALKAHRVCPCCHNFVATQRLGYFASFRRIAEASPSYALYFYFLLFVLFVLLLNFVILGVNLLMAVPKTREVFVSSNYGWDILETFPDCEATYTANTNIRGILSVVNIVFLIIAKQFFLRFAVNKRTIFDQEQLSPSDFTLALKMPVERNDQELREDIARVAGRHVRVVKINRVYDVFLYTQEMERLLRVQKEIKRLEAEGKTQSSAYQKTQRRYQLRLEHFNKICLRYRTERHLRYQATRLVYVTFATDLQCKQVRRSFASRAGSWDKTLEAYKVRQAPEPDNIQWQNFGLEPGQKLARRLLSYIVAILMIGGVFGLVLLVKIAQARFLSLNPEAKVQAAFFSVLVTIFITACGQILTFMLQTLTGFERRTLFSSERFNFTFKIFISGFLSSSLTILLTTFLANYFVTARMYQGVVPSWVIWTRQGVVTAITIFQLTSIVQNHLLELFNPKLLLSALKRWWCLRQSKKSGKVIFQIELNKAYENPPHSLDQQYARVMQTLSMAFFYSPIMPYATLLAALDVLLRFLVQRYVVLKCSAKPREFDPVFTHRIMELFQICEVLYGVGCIAFDFIVGCRMNVFSFVVLGLALADFLLICIPHEASPTQRSSVLQERDYETHRHALVTDYDRENPITQRAALKEWLREGHHDLRKSVEGVEYMMLAGSQESLKTSTETVLPEPHLIASPPKFFVEVERRPFTESEKTPFIESELPRESDQPQPFPGQPSTSIQIIMPMSPEREADKPPVLSWAELREELNPLGRPPQTMLNPRKMRKSSRTSFNRLQRVSASRIQRSRDYGDSRSSHNPSQNNFSFVSQNPQTASPLAGTGASPPRHNPQKLFESIAVSPKKTKPHSRRTRRR